MLLGVLSLATLPAAIAVPRRSREYELLDAGFAIPLALLLGGLAILLARRARRTQGRLLGRAPGQRAARIGRFLGLTGFLLAVTAAMAVGVYYVLAAVAE